MKIIRSFYAAGQNSCVTSDSRFVYVFSDLCLITTSLPDFSEVKTRNFTDPVTGVCNPMTCVSINNQVLVLTRDSRLLKFVSSSGELLYLEQTQLFENSAISAVDRDLSILYVRAGANGLVYSISVPPVVTTTSEPTTSGAPSSSSGAPVTTETGTPAPTSEPNIWNARALGIIIGSVVGAVSVTLIIGVVIVIVVAMVLRYKRNKFLEEKKEHLLNSDPEALY